MVRSTASGAALVFKPPQRRRRGLGEQFRHFLCRPGYATGAGKLDPELWRYVYAPRPGEQSGIMSRHVSSPCSPAFIHECVSLTCSSGPCDMNEAL